MLLFGLHTSTDIDMNIFLQLEKQLQKGCGLQYFFLNAYNGALISLQCPTSVSFLVACGENQKGPGTRLALRMLTRHFTVSPPAGVNRIN